MDSDRVREIIRRRYAAIAADPAGQFRYPVGRESAENLGYPADVLEALPPDVVRYFVGVGNPFRLGDPEAGMRVVDVGCGAGFDSLVAARRVGPAGRVIGVDMSREMLLVARAGLSIDGAVNVTFAAGRAEDLPVSADWADLVISNGVLNLAACKVSAFAEIARVLRPGGRFQAADLILVKDLPEDLRTDEFAWSG